MIFTCDPEPYPELVSGLFQDLSLSSTSMLHNKEHEWFSPTPAYRQAGIPPPSEGEGKGEGGQNKKITEVLFIKIDLNL